MEEASCEYCGFKDFAVCLRFSRFNKKICGTCIWCEENYMEKHLPNWVWERIKHEPHN